MGDNKVDSPKLAGGAKADSDDAAVVNANVFERAVGFVTESKKELGRVIFPTRNEVIGSTIVVILSVVCVSLFLGAVDLGLTWLMSNIVG